MAKKNTRRKSIRNRTRRNSSRRNIRNRRNRRSTRNMRSSRKNISVKLNAQKGGDRFFGRPNAKRLDEQKKDLKSQKNPGSRDDKDVIDIFNVEGNYKSWAGTLVVPNDDNDDFVFYTLTTNGKKEYDGYKNHGNTISGTKIAALDKDTKETEANDTLQKAILAALDYKEDPDIETLNKVVIGSSEASTEMIAIADKLRTMLIKIKDAAIDIKIATDKDTAEKQGHAAGLAAAAEQALKVEAAGQAQQSSAPRTD